MKRKRRGRPKKAVGKKPTPEAPVNADAEVFLNFVEKNVDDNGVANEVSNNEVGQLDTAKELSSSLSPSSSSSGRGGAFRPAQDNDSSDELETSGRITISANMRGRSQMNGEAAMKAANAPVMSSRGVGSTVMPSKGKRSKVVSSRGFSSMGEKELPSVKKPSQDPRYNKEELQACLGVINKIMQMEEAVSFCSPVDPIAQGIPDYFSVIDTPMDFGTICSNLRNDVKYMNSYDVYKDVEYIWENCSKYNKKGDYIVYLMKRVKKKFTKYWTEAGLRTEMQTGHDGHSHVAPPSVHTMRQSRHEAMSVVDNMVNSYQNQQDRFGTNHPPSRVQQDRFGTDQPPSRVNQPSYAHPYMYHQPQPSASIMPQYSQFHAGVGSNYTGHYMPGPPLTAHPMEQERQEPSHPFPPLMNNPTHSQQQQPQLSSCYMWQSHQTTSQPQPSQSHFLTDTRHQQSLHPRDYAVPHNGYVPRSSMDPIISSVGQPQPQPQPQLQHRLSSHHRQDRSNLPQTSIVPPQSSHQAASADVSSPGMPPVDVSNRERRYMKRSSSGARNDVHVVCSLPQQHSVVGQKQPVTSQTLTLEKKRRVRGPTRCRFMEDLPEGHRIYVPFNKRGQPIGIEALKLASFIGSLARDCEMAPLSYLEWSAMPEAVKENMWQVVQTKFDIDPLCKRWFLKSLGSKWRNWKAKLKADHYTPYTTDEERLRNCHERVDPDQWAALIAHWNSEDVQIRAMKNKANRAKQVNYHASGSKSFARILEEEKAKRNGKELTRSELYILTRTKKDGQPVDDVAAERIEKLRERANRKEQTSGASSDADTFCEVMGKETGTHVRMYGCGGPTIGEVYGRKSSRSHILEVALEAKRSANEEVGKMMSKMEAMEHKYSSLESQIAQMNSNMQILIEKMGGMDSKQVDDNPPPEDSPQAQSHSSSSSHPVEVEDEEGAEA